jgi:hypothetical protein
MKKIVIKISLVMMGLLFSVSTVYAASDAYQNFLDWANQEKNKVQLHLKTNLDESVEKEISVLNEKTNHLISGSNKEIFNMGLTEMEDTKNAIHSTLTNHQKNLELSASELGYKSANDFSEMEKKLNTMSSRILDSIETDYRDEMRNITYNNTLDNASIKENKMKSEKNLREEIKLTKSTIKQLKQVQAGEENQHIKDYIQRRIDLLEQLITILQEG